MSETRLGGRTSLLSSDKRTLHSKVPVKASLAPKVMVTSGDGGGSAAGLLLQPFLGVVMVGSMNDNNDQVSTVPTRSTVPVVCSEFNGSGTWVRTV